MNTSILDKAIRRIPDFPKAGILFYDITSVLTQPQVFSDVIKTAVSLYKDKPLTAIAAIESRGFIFAAPIALSLSLPLILIRKKGKLPGKTYSASYSLEYGSAEIEVHQSDVTSGSKVLLVDDLIATGGTLKAAKQLLEQGGARAEEIFGVIGLPDLHYKETLSPTPVTTLIDYQGE